MNTICMTFHTHTECPLHFNVWPLVTAIVEETRLVLVHPLNYDANLDLARFFDRAASSIFNVLSVMHHASFTDVTHDFKISTPPVPPRSPPPKPTSKIDWAWIDSGLDQSSLRRSLLMKPYVVPHLAENLPSLHDLSAMVKGSRVMSFGCTTLHGNAMFYQAVDFALDAEVPFDTYSVCAHQTQD